MFEMLQISKKKNAWYAEGESNGSGLRLSALLPASLLLNDLQSVSIDVWRTCIQNNKINIFLVIQSSNSFGEHREVMNASR